MKKDENITTNFEATDNADLINKAYLDRKLKKKDGHIPLLEKIYNEFKIFSDKQSIDEVVIQRAVKRTIRNFYDKEFFDSFPNADEVFEEFPFVTRRRGVLEESKGCCSMILFKKIS